MNPLQLTLVKCSEFCNHIPTWQPLQSPTPAYVTMPSQSHFFNPAHPRNLRWKLHLPSTYLSRQCLLCTSRGASANECLETGHVGLYILVAAQTNLDVLSLLGLYFDFSTNITSASKGNKFEGVVIGNAKMVTLVTLNLTCNLNLLGFLPTLHLQSETSVTNP